MTYKLSVTIDHKSMPEPMQKTYFYTGETKDDILEQIDTLPFHRNNLKNYGTTKFKDIHGMKHHWVLTHEKHLN